MENLKNQERQPANAATPEKAEEKGQTPKQGKKEARTSDSGRDAQAEEDARVSVVLSRVSGAMWLIFAPSDSDEPLREGFNVDVPMPEDKGLLSDKKTAYEQSAFEKKQKGENEHASGSGGITGTGRAGSGRSIPDGRGHGQRQSVYPFLGQCLSGHQPAVGQFL